MADENVSTELTFEQELDAILNPGTAPVPGSEGKPEDKAQPPAASPEAASKPPEGEAVVDPLLAALEEIKDDTPAEAADDKTKTALTEEQQRILRAVPDAATAENLRQTAENHKNFSNAFEQGRFEDVEAMFKAWNPAAYDTFLENLYVKHVASGEWVDRFVAENDPKGPGPQTNKALRTLEKRLSEVQKQLADKESGQQKETAESAQKKAFVAYSSHVSGLLDQIKFSEADRPWVVSTLNSRVAADQTLMKAIRAGDVNAVNKLFKTTVREYVTRDKALSDSKAAKVELQDKKVLPVGGAAATNDGALPDDIKQVPKGQEDTWLDQQLGKLSRFVKR